MRKALKLAFVGTLLAGSLGLWAPAHAYCMTLPGGLDRGKCINHCYTLSEAYETVTGQGPGWGCPD